MFDILCALPLSSELFTQALHPRTPLLSVGLASGHVQTFRLPGDADTDATSPPPSSSLSASSKTSTSSNGGRRSSLSSHVSPTPLITSLWRTRRHKGSCRTLAYSAVDGRFLLSGGTDGLVKAADAETGRVVSKIGTPSSLSSPAEAPCTIHALTPTAFLLGTDSGRVHLYDTRCAEPSSTFFAAGARPVATWQPHGPEPAVCICAVPPSQSSTSGLPRSFVSTGGGSVALTDVRKGIIAVSAEGIEPLTSCAISHPSGRLVVADGAGTLSAWDRSGEGPKSAVLRWPNDPAARAKVDIRREILSPEGERLPVPGDEVAGQLGGAGVDVLCAVPNDNDSKVPWAGRDCIVMGWDTGRVEVLALHGKGGGRKGATGHKATTADVVADFPPDVEGDGVAGLGFDATGRLVVGLGGKVVIYAQAAGEAVDDGSEDEMEEDSDDDERDEAVSSKGVGSGKGTKRPAQDSSEQEDGDEIGGDGDGEDKDSDNEEADSSEEERSRPKKKKKRKGKVQKNHLAFNIAGID